MVLMLASMPLSCVCFSFFSFSWISDDVSNVILGQLRCKLIHSQYTVRSKNLCGVSIFNRIFNFNEVYVECDELK